MDRAPPTMMKNAFNPVAAHPVTALHGSVALPFVIPSEAEGSAVPRTIPGNVFSTERNPDFPATMCRITCESRLPA
jgi:hypothetical protein